MKTKYTFSLSEDHNKIIKDVLGAIERDLSLHKRTKKYIKQSLMLSEEVLLELLGVSTEGDLHLSITTDIWDSIIKISAPGSKMEYNFGGKNDEAEIRNLVLDAYQDKLNIKYADGFNSVRISVGVRARTMALECFAADIIGILLFIISRYAFGGNASLYLVEKVFEPASELFYNLLQLLLLPVIFLSIISVVSKLANTKNMESSVGRKSIVSTIATSIIATLIGIGAFRIFDSIIPNEAYELGDIATKTVGNMSFSEVFFQLVPKNIFSPFIENNVFQVIFLAVVFGLCINLVGEHSQTFMDANNALFELTKKVVEGIGRVLPIGIFCSSFIVCERFGLSFFKSLLGTIACLIIAFVAMYIIYLLLIAIATRLNPFHFVRKVKPLIFDLIKFGSGTDALPATMRFCRTKLGVPAEVYTVSLPIGAQFNLDGTCIYMAIMGFYLSRLNGINMYGNSVIAIVFSIVALSIGAPNMTGSSIVSLLTLLASIGIPSNAVCAVLCVDSIIYLGIAVLNTLGDLVVSMLIAKRQGVLDENVYNRP